VFKNVMRHLRPMTALTVIVSVPAAVLPFCSGAIALASLTPPTDPQDASYQGMTSLKPPPWQIAPTDAALSSWQPVPSERSLPPEFSAIPARRNARDLEAQPRLPTRKYDENAGIYGIGGGLRWGGVSTGQPNTNGLITGRVGYKLNNDLAISARPTYVFQGTNAQGFQNGAFRMPLTLDLFRTAIVSPYIGGGIATNTNSSGYTDPMLTGGIDIKLHENVALGFNFNYIFQTQLNTNVWEAMTLLYLKF
jgi:hypothetical protein